MARRADRSTGVIDEADREGEPGAFKDLLSMLGQRGVGATTPASVPPGASRA